jgi:hypothetical protein
LLLLLLLLLFWWRWRWWWCFSLQLWQSSNRMRFARSFRADPMLNLL